MCVCVQQLFELATIAFNALFPSMQKEYEMGSQSNSYAHTRNYVYKYFRQINQLI